MQPESDFDEELKKLVNGEPFRPFVIVTASGDRYPVARQSAVGLSGDVVFVTVRDFGAVAIRIYNVVALEQPNTF